MTQFESNYTIDVLNDISQSKNFLMPFFAGGSESVQKVVLGNITTGLDILEDRWTDGRKYCAGEEITASDFQLLCVACSYLNNTAGGKHPDWSKTVADELVKRENIVRIIDQVRSENGLDEYIKSMPKMTF